VLLVAEVAVRAGESSLPTPRLWSGPEMPVKEEQMAALRTRGGASVVFMGSSTMDAAADPSRFDVAGADRPLYNASAGAGSMRMIDIWGRLTVVPALDPDVVVLGVVSRELNPNDAEQARNERAFLESKAVRRLLGTEPALQEAERRVADVSALVEYRSVLRQPRRVWDTVRTGTFRSGEFGEIISDDGQYEGFLHHTLADAGASRERVAQTVLRDFEIGQRQVLTLRGLLAALTERGIRVIVVSMPVAGSYVAAHPGGVSGYREAVAIVEAEAARAGARFVDIGPWPDDLMADAGHVNEQGVERFARALEPVIEAELG
jgi:hypothetical protein